MLKKLLLLALALALAVCPCLAGAEGASPSAAFLLALPGHDAARRQLAPREQKLYDYLKEQLLSLVASGGSAEIPIPEAAVDYGAFTLNAEEAAALFDAENDSSAPVFSALRDRVWDLVHIAVIALESDEPGLFFWEKGSVTKNDVLVPMTSSSLGAWVHPGEIVVRFPVLSAYGGGTALARDALARSEASLARAQSIIDRYASLSDYEKLRGYLDEIVALGAYISDETHEGNDRNLVLLFDGDPDTGVVCVGFARAYAYLCSHTAFESPDIKCLFIAGMLDSGPSYHAWNVVTMADGKNYLVDATFADSDETFSYRYFLRGQAGGSPAEGYLIPRGNGQFARYAYGNGVMTDMDCLRLFGEENLTLSDTDEPGAQADREAQQAAWAASRPRLLAATPGVVPGESAENLFDNSADTKWCVYMAGSAFVEWQEPEPKALWGFVMATGNDNSVHAGRNPASWVLSGRNSLDEPWQTLWAMEQDAFMQNVDKTAYLWRLNYGGSAPKPYLYFRLEITQTQGDAYLQLSKIEIQPSAE